MLFGKSWNSWMKEAGRGHLTAFLTWGSFFIYIISTVTKLRFYSDYTFFGIGSLELLYISAGLGLTLSLHAFFYLFQAKKLDFYYSLPVKKQMIFISRYFHGLLHFTAALIVSMALCGVYQTTIDHSFISCAAGYTARSVFFYWLAFLIFYNIGVFAAVICGRLVSFVCAAAVLMLYFQFLIEKVWMALAKCFFQTFYRSPLLENVETVLVPFRLSEYLTGAGVSLFEQTDVWKYSPPLFVSIAAVLWNAVFFSASVCLYRKRKAEGTGKVLVFSYAERTVEVLLTMLAGGYAGNLAAEICSVSTEAAFYEYVIFVLTGIAGVILLHLFLEWAVLFPGKKVFRRNRQMLAEAAAAGVMLLVFPGMASVYDSYLPAEEKTEAVSVALGGLDMTYKEYLEVKSGKDTYITERLFDKYRLSGEGKEAVFAWIKGNQIEAKNKNKYKDMRNDEDVQCEVSRVILRFQMKNGIDKYRTYQISFDDFCVYASVYETEEYLRKAYPAINRDEAEKAKVTWTDGVTEQILKLSDSEKKELLAIYRADILSMEMENLKTALPVGFVEIESEIDREDERMVIYPFFEQTCTFLSEKGAAVGKTISDYKVISIQLTKTSQTLSNAVGGTAMYFYDKPEEIETKAEHIVPEAFDLQPVFFSLKYNESVEAEIEDEDTLSVRVVEGYGCESE